MKENTEELFIQIGEIIASLIRDNTQVKLYDRLVDLPELLDKIRYEIAKDEK